MRYLIKTNSDLIQVENEINSLLTLQNERELTDNEANRLDNLQIEVDSYCEND